MSEKREAGKAVRNLFKHGESYPRDYNETGPAWDDDSVHEREMQIHICRADHGDLLLAGATTGRKHQSKVEWRCQFWGGHKEPQLNSTGGWKTRFDNSDENSDEITYVVSLFYRGEPSDDEYGVYGITETYAQFSVIQKGKMNHTYFRLYPGGNLSVGILVDDGQQDMCEVMLAAIEQHFERHTPPMSIKVSDVPEDILGSLLWAADRIQFSFGQGKIPQLKRKS